MLVGPAINGRRRLTLHKQQVSSTAIPRYRERRGVLMLLLCVSVFFTYCITTDQWLCPRTLLMFESGDGKPAVNTIS